ncbi:hypothetical protein DB346_23435 [Verrucomicrobia bacterium LW23]|nr:hypothetical protein DB346_23435 [Verrucomicrobia bacterium LW23]
MGAFTFPTPFLVLFYTADITPAVDDVQTRFAFVIFLILSGGMLGAIFYYKDTAINTLKDWFPSDRIERAERKRGQPDNQLGGTPGTNPASERDRERERLREADLAHRRSLARAAAAAHADDDEDEDEAADSAGADDYRPTRNKRTSPSESPVSTRRSSGDQAS